MLKYEICGCERHIEHEEFEGYRKGIVYNSGAPSWEEAIYDTLEEAEVDFSRRRSTCHLKGNGYLITEYTLLEVDCYIDGDGWEVADSPGRLIEIAPLETSDKVLDIV